MITSHHACSIPGAIVCIIGRELDFRNAAYFHRQYDELLEQGFRYFILDFSGTDVFDSSGLGAIFGLHKRIAPVGGQAMFVAPSRSVATVMRLIRLERVFRTYSSVESALADLSAAQPATNTAPVPASVPEPAADTSSAAEPSLPAEPAPPEHVDEAHATVEPDVERSAVHGPEAPREIEAPVVIQPADEPAEAGDHPGAEAAWDSVIAGEPEGQGTVPGSPFVTHTVTYADIPPEVAPPEVTPPAIPSPQPAREELQPDVAPGRASLQDLLDLLRSYGLIQRYALQPAHVLLYLFEDGQPLDMDYAEAEAFCLDLKRSLPVF